MTIHSNLSDIIKKVCNCSSSEFNGIWNSLHNLTVNYLFCSSHILVWFYPWMLKYIYCLKSVVFFLHDKFIFNELLTTSAILVLWPLIQNGGQEWPWPVRHIWMQIEFYFWFSCNISNAIILVSYMTIQNKLADIIWKVYYCPSLEFNGMWNTLHN